ncbi:MAG: hypothetical protein WCO06_00700 [Candidatus Roizmanbacteria bacterium]
MKWEKISFATIFIFVVVFFYTSFSLLPFLDDFFHFHLAEFHTITDILRFFNPLRDFFYRPLSTEIFYAIMRVFGIETGKIIIFCTFCIGLIFFYRSILYLVKERLYAMITTFLYAIHFTHVFQLYYLGTYQEVALFAFLVSSFYFYIVQRKIVSVILFVCALLSKETAILYPFFLLTYELSLFFIKKEKHKEEWNWRSFIPFTKSFFSQILPFGIISGLFLIIYYLGVKNVSQLEIYTFHFSPRIILNNSIWYFLWSLGLPSFLPDYIYSFFAPPLPSFWIRTQTQEYQLYQGLLVSFYGLFSIVCCYVLYMIRDIKKIVLGGSLFFLSFLLFLLPTIGIIHRWMVRLTLPVLFTSLCIGWIIFYLLRSKKIVLRIIGILLIVLYSLFNWYGVKVHEISSYYLLEDTIVRNLEVVLKKNKSSILQKGSLYFKDAIPGSWTGSEKIKNTLHGQDFISYYFVGKNIRVYYEFETKHMPKDTFVIESNDLIRGIYTNKK